MPPPPRTVIDTVAYRFSDLDIFQRIAERLDDGSMAWKVDIIRMAATAKGVLKLNYVTTTTVAANGTAINTYTVTAAKTLSLGKIIASCRGALKVQVQYGPSGSLATALVGFTSASNPTLNIDFGDFSIPVPSTSSGGVVVTMTNEDNQPLDVYSTIVGLEN